METFKEKIECKSCNATGLYVGYAERDGSAVVCQNCNGTGCFDFVVSYVPFKERRKKRGIKRVYQHNPGIGIGTGDGKYSLEDFGGITTDQFYTRHGKNKFPLGTEMRKFTCPAWWYQSIDYKLKPKWDECAACGSFSKCSSFPTKSNCWARFDKEMKKGK